MTKIAYFALIAIIAILIFGGLGVIYLDNLTTSTSSTDLTNLSTTVAIIPTTNVSPIIEISGNNQTQNIQITNQTKVDLIGNYENLSITLDTDTILTIEITGNHNTVTLLGGKVTVNLNGNYNVIYARDTIIFSQNLLGDSDKIVAVH